MGIKALLKIYYSHNDPENSFYYIWLIIQNIDKWPLHHYGILKPRCYFAHLLLGLAQSDRKYRSKNIYR